MNHLTRNVRFLKGELAQDQYAKQVGVNQSSISRLLGGRVAPTLDTVTAIAAHHKLTLDDLVNRDLEKDGPSQSHGGRPSLNKLGVALVAIERAIRSRRLDPADSWGKLAKLVLWAVDLQDDLYPNGVRTKADLLGFDAQVEVEMSKGEYDGIRGIESKAEGSTEGARGAAAARKAPGRRGRGANS